MAHDARRDAGSDRTPRPLRVRIVANPISGFGAGDPRAHETARLLARQGCDAAVYVTKARGDAEAFARAEGPDLDVLVCTGGDGTVNEMVNGIHGHATPLALLPTGTANVLAKEFGLTADPARVASAVLGGRAVALDALRCRGRLLMAVGGVGFDAAVARGYGRARRGRGSFSAYAAPLLDQFLHFPFPRLEVDVDGRRIEGPVRWALVSNTRAYGGPLVFCPAADPADGIADLAIIRRARKLDLLRFALFALLRLFHRAPHAEQLRGTRFSIRPLDGDTPLQLDGDAFGSCGPDDPAVFELVPRAFTLLLPPGP